MSDYLTPDQIRDLYAEIIDKHVGVHERDTDVRKLMVYEAVDALAAAGLLPTVHLCYQVDGQQRSAYRTPLRFTSAERVALDAELAAEPLNRVVDDVPPPAPGKGRGPR